MRVRLNEHHADTKIVRHMARMALVARQRGDYKAADTMWSFALTALRAGYAEFNHRLRHMAKPQA